MGRAMRQFLQRFYLLEDPSVLEVLEYLPSGNSYQEGVLESSTLSVLTLRAGTLNGSLLQARPSRATPQSVSILSRRNRLAPSQLDVDTAMDDVDLGGATAAGLSRCPGSRCGSGFWNSLGAPTPTGVGIPTLGPGVGSTILVPGGWGAEPEPQPGPTPHGNMPRLDVQDLQQVWETLLPNSGIPKCVPEVHQGIAAEAGAEAVGILKDQVLRLNSTIEALRLQASATDRMGPSYAGGTAWTPMGALAQTAPEPSRGACGHARSASVPSRMLHSPRGSSYWVPIAVTKPVEEQQLLYSARGSAYSLQPTIATSGGSYHAGRSSSTMPLRVQGPWRDTKNGAATSWGFIQALAGTAANLAMDVASIASTAGSPGLWESIPPVQTKVGVTGEESRTIMAPPAAKSRVVLSQLFALQQEARGLLDETSCGL